MDEKTFNSYETMKQNKSLEPIADLLRLAEVAEMTAKEAEEIGDKLSVFACQAEASKENLPPVTAWMKLCDIYKEGAREFARLLHEAIKASRVEEIEANLQDYSDEVVDKTAWLVANDKEFRNMFRAAVRGRLGDEGKKMLEDF